MATQEDTDELLRIKTMLVGHRAIEGDAGLTDDDAKILRRLGLLIQAACDEGLDLEDARLVQVCRAMYQRDSRVLDLLPVWKAGRMTTMDLITYLSDERVNRDTMV